MTQSVLNLESCHEAVAKNLPEAVAFLKRLVAENSYTKNPRGIARNIELICRQFADFDFQVIRRPCSSEGTGEHLVLDSGGDGLPLACIAHLDTVFPEEEERANNFHWREEGSMAFGPGTCDIKGGTALLWLTLASLRDWQPNVFTKYRWILLWNAAEEILAPDFNDFCLELLPKDTRACLVFEPDNEAHSGYSLVTGRKGRNEFLIQVLGRGAHAGNGHSHGANAVHELSLLVPILERMSDASRDLTVNVGQMEGGLVANRVPHAAKAALEMRAYDRTTFDEITAKILALAGTGKIQAQTDGFRCRIETSAFGTIPPWQAGTQEAQLASVWQQAGRHLGIPVGTGRRGGVSDANKIAAFFPTLDGLGPRGGNAHSSERSADGSKQPEYVDLASFPEKAALNVVSLCLLNSPPEK